LIRRGYYPGRGYYYRGRGYYYPGRGYYYPGRGYNASAGDNNGAGDNTGGGDSFLTEKIRRLEEMVRNLSSQLQSSPPPVMDGGPGNAAPPEKEFYRY
jgi:hypothetical protein